MFIYQIARFIHYTEKPDSLYDDLWSDALNVTQSTEIILIKQCREKIFNSFVVRQLSSNHIFSHSMRLKNCLRSVKDKNFLNNLLKFFFNI